MNIIEPLNWRYATKKFDSNKKISAEDFKTLMEATILSPSSFGLAPWRIINVENAEMREKLKAHSWNQEQITDASHLVVLCIVDDVNEEYINEHVDHIAQVRNVPADELKQYADMMKGFLLNDSPIADTKDHWSKHQAYLALGNMLTTAANMKIDACPIEGFMPHQYDEILNLPEKGLKSAVVCALGYRSEEDFYARIAKVRKSYDTMIHTV